MTAQKNPGAGNSGAKQADQGAVTTNCNTHERVREVIADSLEYAKGLPVKNYANTEIIFRDDPVLKHVGLNIMGGVQAWRQLPPWRSADDTLRSLSEYDIMRVDRVIRGYYGGSHNALPKAACDSARGIHAGDNPFSPVRDYLNSLPDWDGVRRIENAIPPECIAGGTNRYTAQVLLNFFLAIASRTYEPGCQVDSMLVLFGDQGLRKTSWLRSIFPPDLPVAELSVVPDNAHEKDSLIACHKAPIAVLDEIDKLRRKDDQSALKAFMSGREDTWRAPYGAVDETHLRSFVVAGTTNKENFLLDTTGNRRYWVLTLCNQIPDQALTRERMDLLLAEARDRYRAGERINFSSEFEADADMVRAAHLDDPVRDAAYELLDTGEVIEGGTVRGIVDWPTQTLINVEGLVALLPSLGNPSKTTPDGKMIREKLTAALDTHPGWTRLDDGKPRRVKVTVGAGDGSEIAGISFTSHGYTVTGGQSRRTWQRVD